MIYVVVDNNNKLVLHYNHQKKEKYTSSTAILEGTPYTKFLNLVPCLILRIHRQRQAKTLDDKKTWTSSTTACDATSMP
jgi:hypothetical protein